VHFSHSVDLLTKKRTLRGRAATEVIGESER
jgi:hypothetical protein